MPAPHSLRTGASGCCYETTVEIAARVKARPERIRASRPGHVLLDLRGVAEDRLGALGIEGERIERVGGCTICDPQWPSWRRDGERAGRLLAYVGWDPVAPEPAGEGR